MRLYLFGLLLLCFGYSHAQNQNFVSNELIIQLAPETNPNLFAKKFEATEQIGILELTQLSDIVNIYLLKFTNETPNLNRISSLLFAYPEIYQVQKNHYISERETIPTDALFEDLWYLKNTGVEGTVDADIDATEAWDITTGGTTTHNDTIVVCIIESNGVDKTHIDIKDNMWINYNEIPDDGIDNDGNGYIDDYEGWNVLTNDDEIGYGAHGTKIAGMIGAKGNNGIGTTGVNWDVKMMVVKGHNTSSEASVITAYDYPLKMRKLYNESYGEFGAFVVVTNASWGINNADAADSPLWCAMYDSLGHYGILNICATTNLNSNVDAVGDMPSTCTSDYLIAVTTTNSDDVRASAGYGVTHVDLGAPGTGVRLTAPVDTYGLSGGTSFASPCVAGAIALVYSAPCADFINFTKFNPSAAALQMRAYILDGVDPITSLTTEVASGGRLNVNNAITLAMDDCDESTCLSPYNVRIADITDTSATIIWEGFSADYILIFEEIGGATVEIPIIGATTIHFDTLRPCASFKITLKADCGVDGLSVASFPIYFTTDGCCKNPPINEVSTTEDAITVSWTDILYATEYNIRYSIIGEEDWTETTTVSSPFTVTDLEKCTKYDFQIHTICGDSTRGYSESYTFRTKGCGVCTEIEYCPVIGANNNLEWIDSLYVNDFSNHSSENEGWLISEQIITPLTPGETYSVRIVPGYAESSFTERYAIFIDLNHNGSFEDAGETVMPSETSFGSINSSLTIPSDATIGVTKIRVGMSSLSSPVPCPTSSFYGEYEDYCVYIGPQVSIDENQFSISIYPNPARNEIEIDSDIQIEKIHIFSTDGKLILTINEYDQTAINIYDLSSGIYILQAETDRGMIVNRFVKN